jgi:carbonic anhydrase/acetyltransferase-like protein (isoleucine patch superfamily)
MTVKETFSTACLNLPLLYVRMIKYHLLLSTEKVFPMIREWNGHKPQIDPSAYIHESAEVIGKVTLKKNVSVWPNAVIRGDIEEIVIGEDTNIQDNTVIHTDIGTPTILGRGISVGHSVILHSCTVKDNCLVGMGAIMLEGVVVEEECLIGAGALVSPGKTIPGRSLVIGIPAKVKRSLELEEIKHIKSNAEDYLKLAESHRRTSKQT